MLHWDILIIVGIGIVVLIVVIVRKNQKDQKDLEKTLNEDYKHDEDESDYNDKQ